tara:strand:- start:144 stop:401 length:258 start_codon:yes stop_codon:yes gene_type:complete
MKYKFHSDAGHGWLAVPIIHLENFNLMRKISRFSYMNGQTAYLEEDCDAPLFIETYKSINGKYPELVELVQKNNTSPIRNYKRFP